MNVRQLQIAADQMRLDILDEITTAQSGHIGGALSICELLAVLYGEHMKIRPEEPGMAGPRPAGIIERPRILRTVCGAGGAWVF